MCHKIHEDSRRPATVIKMMPEMKTNKHPELLYANSTKLSPSKFNFFSLERFSQVKVTFGCFSDLMELLVPALWSTH